MAMPKEWVQHHVSALVEEMLGSRLEPHRPFMEAGLDSLGAVELHSNLCAAFKCELPATVVFDFPNINALATYISAKLARQDATDNLPSSHA